MGLETGDPALVVTSTESERGASGWVFWVPIRYAITSFYFLYLGCPEIDILLGAWRSFGYVRIPPDRKSVV